MNGTTPQVTTRQQETILCRLPIWDDDEMTLEGQGRQQECNKNSNMARSDCVNENHHIFVSLLCKLALKLCDQAG